MVEAFGGTVEWKAEPNAGNIITNKSKLINYTVAASNYDEEAIRHILNAIDLGRVKNEYGNYDRDKALKYFREEQNMVAKAINNCGNTELGKELKTLYYKWYYALSSCIQILNSSTLNEKLFDRIIDDICPNKYERKISYLLGYSDYGYYLPKPGETDLNFQYKRYLNVYFYRPNFSLMGWEFDYDKIINESNIAILNCKDDNIGKSLKRKWQLLIAYLQEHRDLTAKSKSSTNSYVFELENLAKRVSDTKESIKQELGGYGSYDRAMYEDL